MVNYLANSLTPGTLFLVRQKVKYGLLKQQNLFPFNYKTA
jgi:hypothetical protein